MRRAFESSGFTVSEAEDGEKAVKHVGWYTPDLIVLDLAMPIMNGLQAAPLLHVCYVQGNRDNGVAG